MNYLVGDFLIRLKNAALARRQRVTIPSSNYLNALVQILQQKGVLAAVKKVKNGKITSLEVRLRYHDYQAGQPVLAGVRLFSKPGRRYYAGVNQLPFPRGKGWVLVSTPKGLMTAHEARQKKLGGEVIAEILLN